MNWRFLFFELNGDGTETFLGADIPITNPVPTRKLSTPHSITGTLTAGTSKDLLLPSGATVLKRKKTTVYVADDNDKIWVGGMLFDFTIDGPSLTFDASGFTAYLKGLPYTGVHDAVEEDPLDLTRLFWDNAQIQPGGNMGMILDATKSPVKIGTPPRDVNFDTTSGENVDFTAYDGAVELNWWSTRDMGGQIDQWAKDTPFDYIEDHVWNGSNVEHYLRLGYPTLGSVRPLPRFVLGENVKVLPSEDYSSDDVVTEVWVFGAGEGQDRVRGAVSVYPVDSLRSVKIVDDKFITNFADAQNRARQIMMSYQPDVPGAGVTELVVNNHSNAQFGTFDIGDVVQYSADTEWGEVLIWVKIVSMTLLPTGQLKLAVVRADTLI